MIVEELVRRSGNFHYHGLFGWFMDKPQVGNILQIVGSILIVLALVKGASLISFSPSELHESSEEACAGDSSNDCETLFYLSSLVYDVVLPLICGAGGIITLLISTRISSDGGNQETVLSTDDE